MECPRTEVFHQLAAGQLAQEHRIRVANHAASCSACHALVEAAVTQHTQRGHEHAAGSPPSRSPVAVGAVIGGRFRIDQVLGAGGMGIVVAATHLELGNRVAVKLMRRELLESSHIIERFVREARAVVQLRTEHVCRVLDVARGDGAGSVPYIVMELLEGTDLARMLIARPLPLVVAVEYVMQACVALAEAHAAGIVHRDLKPGNLFVTRRADGGPLVKVLDFGIAKAFAPSGPSLTRTHITLGSPGYMSPEQIESARDVDARTDLWSLGVTLYQLLSGRLPFHGPNATEVAIKIEHEAPAPIDVDPRVRAIVLRCLEKARDRRYPDVAALAAALAPFGGPDGRRIATAVAQMATRSIATPLPTSGAPLPTTPLPFAASIGAVTVPTASGPSSMPAPASIRAPSTSGPPPSIPTPSGAPTVPTTSGQSLPPSRASVPIGVHAVHAVVQRRSRIALVGAIVAIGLVAVGLALLLRDGAATDQPSLDAASAVATSLHDAASTVVVPRDAVVDRWQAIEATSLDAGDAAPADPAAHTARPDAGTRQRSRSAAPMPDFATQMREQCLRMTSPALADSIPPVVVVMCWCQLRDQAHARTAFAKLTVAKDRAKLQTACKQFGVTLP